MARINERKIAYEVDKGLRRYLKAYGREMDLPIHYSDLLRYSEGVTLYDKYGNDTLWISLIYSQDDLRLINSSLKEIYAILRANGDMSVMQHLYVDRIELCLYGNSNPFRVRIVNKINDNFDYFYIKNAVSPCTYSCSTQPHFKLHLPLFPTASHHCSPPFDHKMARFYWHVF